MTVTARTPLEVELSAMMVEALNLEIGPDEIDPEAPLYGEGLGLDSIDLLELSLAINQRYAVQLQADDAENQHIFRSLRSLARYIDAHRPA